MGVDAADYDQDGWIDLFEANVDQEMFSLYHNDKNEVFTDAALPNGIGSATRLLSGWGLKFLDYDNDGNLDLLLCNGHPDDRVDQRVQGVKFLESLHEPENKSRIIVTSLTNGPAFGGSERGQRGQDQCGQATKGMWGMSWRQKAKKGVEDCDKPGEVVKRAMIPGYPNERALNP